MSIMQVDAHRRDWEEFASVGDPFWAVVADPKLKYGRWDADAFYAGGRREIDAMMRRAAELGRPARHATALDFGCGVGRLTRALGAHFDEVLGIDISEAMIGNARRLNAGHPHCSFALNVAADLGSLSDESFDLVHTRIVLQHQPSRAAIERYLSELLRVLRTDGLLVFQLPSRLSLAVRAQPRVNAYRLLRRLGATPRFLYWRLGLHPASMRHIPVEEVAAFIDSNGGRVLAIETEWQRRYHFESALYYVARE
jgi:SAM-dependent methyltransferase